MYLAARAVGALFASVMEGSPAALDGCCADDVCLAVNGAPVTNKKEFLKCIMCVTACFASTVSDARDPAGPSDPAKRAFSPCVEAKARTQRLW